MLYLSHEIPEMAALEALYVNIWTFVHAKEMMGSDEDIESIVECTRSAMFSTLKYSDLEVVLAQDLECYQVNELWHDLIDMNIINNEGKILKVKEIKSNENMFNACKHISDDLGMQQMILQLCKESLRQVTTIHIPVCLQDFVSANLYQFVENAFKARYMVINDNYIIDIDRSDAASTLDPNIIIIDKDTGVEQYNCQWSNGLHQFLQLKHGCRLSQESLKAVFMSNVSFFKQYDSRIIGLSGTLGSKAEREFLNSFYGIDFASIPTDKQPHFEEYTPRVCTSTDMWLREIERSVLKHKERPMLLICQNILDVEKIGNFLKDKADVEQYKHSYEDVIKRNEISKPCILVCTNLAGRGTDIRISDSLNAKGGLHVCLTYLPENKRIEEQAFGRAARKGQKGSGQLICLLDDHFEQVSDCSQLAIHMKIQRNLREEEKIEKLASHFNDVIAPEEIKFRTFKNEYQKIEKYLDKTVHIQKDLSRIMLNNCLDEWAFWLDKMNSQKDKMLMETVPIVQTMVKAMARKDDSETIYKTLLTRPAHILRFALTVIRKHDCDTLAKKITSFKAKTNLELSRTFLNSLLSDPFYGHIAHYHMCAIWIKKGPTEEELPILEEHIRAAKDGFQQKAQQQTEYASAITMLSEQYKSMRQSFVILSDYVKQKSDINMINDIFIQSLQDMTGRPFTLEAIHKCPSVGIREASTIYLKLQKSSLISKASIKTPANIQNRDEFLDVVKKIGMREGIDGSFTLQDKPKVILQCFQQKYELYYGELEMRLEELKSKPGFTIDDFKGILPCRDEFWDVVKKTGMLSEEQNYVICHVEEIEKYAENQNDEDKCNELMLLVFWINEIAQCQENGYKQFSSEFHRYRNEQNTDRKCVPVCIYPEKLYSEKQLKEFSVENARNPTFIAIPMQDFEDINKWRVLIEMNMLTVNKTAILNYDKNKRLEQFDSLKEKHFEEIVGVTEHIVTNIVEDLIGSGTLVESHQCQVMLSEDFKAVKLTKHRHFETEVENVLIKRFRYRLAMKEAIAGNFTLPVKPEKDLFDDLVADKIVQPDIISPEYISEESIIDELRLILDYKKASISDKTKAFVKKQLIKLCIKHDNCNIQDIGNMLYKSVPHLVKFDTNDSKYQSLSECDISKEDMKRMKTDLDIFQANALGGVLRLQEKRWSLESLLKVGLIALIGVCQIAVGIVAEVITAGASTLISTALIGEGVSDIMYALTSLISGYCSLKEYAKHKVVSVVATTIGVLTMGIGTFITRGAKFSQYGFKLGRKITENLVEKQIWKAVIRRAGIRLLKEAGSTLLDLCAIQKLKVFVENVYDKLKKAWTKQNDLVSDIKQLAKKVCRYGGVEKAKQILIVTFGTLCKFKLHERINELLKKLAKHCFGGIWGSFIDTLRHCTVTSVIMKFAQNIQDKLGDVKTNLAKVVSTSCGKVTQLTDLKAEEIAETMLQQLNDTIDKKLQEGKDYLMQKLLEKAEEQLVTNVVPKMMECSSKMYGRFQEAYTTRQLRRLRDERDRMLPLLAQRKSQHKTAKSLLELLAKTRNVDMFCDILRDDLLGGQFYAQVVAELTGRPVKLIPDDPSTCISHTCLPKTVTNWQSINIRYDVMEHWPEHKFIVDSGTHNCFIEACESDCGKSLSKNDVIEIIKTSERICEKIQSGEYGKIIKQGAGVLQKGRPPVSFK